MADQQEALSRGVVLIGRAALLLSALSSHRAGFLGALMLYEMGLSVAAELRRGGRRRVLAPILPFS
ncbi:MAG: hypothetical protein ACLUE1_07005 [Adlercreutzia equolifaciens]